MTNPQNCVILVPVGGSIVPECDQALRVLESRGYTVRKVRGYSQVDVCRCQMATDALADGFEELFWIDSDVVFDPNDVDRLRSHQLPFVCAIYPKKGPREFACNYLPGTSELVFGQAGGLSELLYAGFGFNYTHRRVYDTIQEQLKLPVCNEQFDSPLIPFFMPMAVTTELGSWYLGEDYAFCERARQCGFRVQVDTQIRLWHVGTYKYSWEDAGGQMERFGNYSFNTGMNWNRTKPAIPTPFSTGLGDPPPSGQHPDPWSQLQQTFPWPEHRPSVVPNLRHGWFSDSSRELLGRLVTEETRLVIELGAWLGMSTRFVLNRSPATKVISVDHWKGSVEHHTSADTARLLPKLHETFLANCWDYRHRLTPLRMATLEGLKCIAERGLQPDLIYIDADHEFDAVKADLELSLELFPAATIIGDDWDWEGVRKAVDTVAKDRGFVVKPRGSSWELMK